MKKYMVKVILFIVPIMVLYTIAILLPPTPRASRNLLFAKVQKDSLLQNVESPRIIFIGGSNLSFGINSEMVRNQLGINPINTAVHAGIGLVYMMDASLEYIQPGDIILLIPEYQHFYGNFAYGSKELLQTVMDTAPSDLFHLNRRQWVNLLPYFPEYAKSKLIRSSYSNVVESDIYGVSSFNEYGDVYAHRELEQREFEPFELFTGEFNQSVINEITQFRTEVEAKGAFLFLSYPGYQTASFNNVRQQIMRIQVELEKHDFNLLGDAERYLMPESMMFNTPYHLTGNGADYRTQLLIQDLGHNELFLSIHRR